jgi:hypothetical protein
MGSFISMSNLKTAAIVSLAVILVQSLTAAQSTILKGAATVAAVALALPLAAKI